MLLIIRVKDSKVLYSQFFQSKLRNLLSSCSLSLFYKIIWRSRKVIWRCLDAVLTLSWRCLDAVLTLLSLFWQLPMMIVGSNSSSFYLMVGLSHITSSLSTVFRQAPSTYSAMYGIQWEALKKSINSGDLTPLRHDGITKKEICTTSIIMYSHAAPPTRQRSWM